MPNSTTSSQQVLMPRCPSCGKGGFTSPEAVSRHMSQPKSGCSTWFDNLVRIREDLQAGGRHNGPNGLHTAPYDESLGHLGEYNQWDDDEMLDGAQEEDPQSSSIEYFPGAAKTYSGGSTFLNKFDTDEFSSCRSSNIYYPFASRGDWQLGSWLLRSGLSMSAMDTLLSLDLVCLLLFRLQLLTVSYQIKALPLSFHTANELRKCAELLPSRPCWKSQEIRTSHPTKRPVTLYWRDSLELVQYLFNCPEFQDVMEFTPYCLYESVACLYCVYTEWMSGDDAWFMQVSFPSF